MSTYSPKMTYTMKLRAALTLALVLVGSLASAQGTAGKGFAIGRYVPTTSGEMSFFVDHPWYSSVRYFSADFTLDYGHNPLILRTSGGGRGNAVIENQLMGHVNLAGSFLDRATIYASLPIVLYENGTAYAGVGPSGANVGDPQLGFNVRLFGQPYKDAFSIHIGSRFWIPVGNSASHAGESGFRALPKLTMGGLTHHVLWSFTGAFMYRPDASIGNLTNVSGATVGSEFQLGFAIAYADWVKRFHIGPEMLVATVVTNGKAFVKNYTSVELLLGGSYNIAKQVQIGVALGTAFLSEPGTPDARVLFRLAYAPIRDNKPKAKVEPPKPVEIADADHDGIDDLHDFCPEVPQGDHPDPEQRGCPFLDEDKDGVADNKDQCPTLAFGDMPDPEKLGCPLLDTDGDGVYDPDDECIDVKQGLHPDPNKKGCPIADRDNDSIPDDVDACPDKPGAPNADPKKNGCPGLVTIRDGKIVIMKPVFFATNKDKILAKSFPVLVAVAQALTATPEIKKMRVEGHTDNQGKADANQSLSQRRAESVRQFLIQNGVEEARLEAKGYGQERPIAPNTTNQGRADNRRVEFHITDPAPPADSNATPGGAQ